MYLVWVSGLDFEPRIIETLCQGAETFQWTSPAKEALVVETAERD